MPTIFQSNKQNHIAERLFDHKDMPRIMQVGKEKPAFHYYAGGPVTVRAHLDWLPEPHRTVALKWFDEGQTPVDMTEYTNPKEEDDRPKHKNTFLCPNCTDTFPSKTKLKSHMEKEHGSKED